MMFHLHRQKKKENQNSSEFLEIKNKVDFEKINEKLEPIDNVNGFMWFFTKRHIWPFIFIEIAAVIIAFNSVIRPVVLEHLIKAIENFKGERKDIVNVIAVWVFAYLGVWLLNYIIKRGKEWIQAWIKAIFESDIRMSAFAYINNHCLEYFTNHFAGSLSNKVQDLGRSGRRLFDFAPKFTTMFLTFIFSLVVFARVHIFFGVVATLWMVIHVSWCFIALRKWNELSRIASEARSTAIGKQVDSLSNYMNVKFFARKRNEYAYVKGYIMDETVKRQANNYNIQKHLMALGMFCFLFMGCFFVYFQVDFYVKGYISLSQFIYLFFALTPVVEAVFEMGFELVDFSLEYGTLKQAFTIIKVPRKVTDKPNAKDIDVFQGEITYKNVSFKYADAKAPVFKNLNLKVESGQKVGIVGRSGVGKTSFINLLMRFYDLTSGEVLIDGQNIADITQESLRRNIALIPQDTTLFHRTLRENIRFGRLDASDEEVLKASKLSFADDFVKKIPLGYDCLVGERGIKLSSGQRQRIAIARAILKNAPILILDEATSALDSETEVFIQESLKSLMKGKTVLAIAHRLSTLREMDRILVFNAGEVVEDGTHESLIHAGGLYADLWKMQSGGFIGGVEKKTEES